MKMKLMLLLIVASVSVQSFAADLMRTMPFLQNPMNGGITVTWLTNQPSYSYVEYGTDKNSLKRAETIVDGQIIAGNTIHRIRLNDIIPGTKYYYRAVSKEITLYQPYKKTFGDSIATEFYEFTIPTKNDGFKALVYNDLHRREETTIELSKQFEDSDYSIAFFNGDCIDDPQNEDDVVNFLIEASKYVGRGSKPLIFIRGNHEIRGAHSIFLRDIIEYSTPQSYGSFSWGDSRFIILDCGEDKPDNHWVYYGLNNFEQFRKDQVPFLKGELKSKEYKKAKNRILIHHIPIYNPEGTEEYNPCFDLWHPILKDADIDVALNAHTHKFAFYQKGELQNNFPIIVGGGYKLEEATVMTICSSEDGLVIRCLDAQGKVLAEVIK